MGGQCGLASEDMNAVASFLHDLGIIVRFKDEGSERVRQLVILDPLFLTKAMATVVSLKSTMVRDGVLRLEDCALIWRPPMFPKELHAV